METDINPIQGGSLEMTIQGGGKEYINNFQEEYSGIRSKCEFEKGTVRFCRVRGNRVRFELRA